MGSSVPTGIRMIVLRLLALEFILLIGECRSSEVIGIPLSGFISVGLSGDSGAFYLRGYGLRIWGVPLKCCIN